MTDLPTINPDVVDDILKEILLPNFLKIILPTLVLILIFGIVRIVFRCMLKGERRLAMIVDAVLCLLFLVTFAFVGLPLTNYMIRHTSISDKEYNLGVNADGTPMDLDGSVEWFDIAEDVEWKDPLETINPYDMVTYVTIPDRTASSSDDSSSK